MEEDTLSTTKVSKNHDETRTEKSYTKPKRPSTESIQVYVRIRPLIERECIGQFQEAQPVRATDDKTVEVKTIESTIRCSYDAVFAPSCSQEKIYAQVKECIQSFLQGFNATLFAYGQTGSGKSFTMFGNEDDASRYRPGLQNSAAGIIPRAIKDIFEAAVRIEQEQKPTQQGDESVVSVYCSFVQMYNENLYDLLRDPRRAAPLEIHEDRKNGLYIEGLSEYAVESVSDCLSLLSTGEQHRAVRATHMNQVSSRSHSVFQIMMEQRTSDGSMLKSKLNLVDLAGSEKWNMSADMQSIHISEMTNINLSLHTLGRCIAALSAKSGPKHVPYRDSKLTRLLQDSLGGNTKTKIIATLSPSGDCLEESIATLKFADRAKQVMVTVRINEEKHIDPAYVEKLHSEIEELRGIIRLLKRSSGNPLSPDLLHEDSREDSVGQDHEVEENNNEQNLGQSIHERLIDVVEQNTALKLENDSLRKELEQSRMRRANEAAVKNGDTGSILEKQKLKDTLRQVRDGLDRFFRFEVEEDELKAIYSRAFNLDSLSPRSTASSVSRPVHGGNQVRKMKEVELHSASINKNGCRTPAGSSGLLFRVRRRTSGPSSHASDKLKGEDWHTEMDGNEKPDDPEKELEQARKAIEKQVKLQNWLVEKERREVLKLQQQQAFMEEQRKLLADKNAKFFKRAAATKKKLQVLAATKNAQEEI